MKYQLPVEGSLINAVPLSFLALCALLTHTQTQITAAQPRNVAVFSRGRWIRDSDNAAAASNEHKFVSAVWRRERTHTQTHISRDTFLLLSFKMTFAAIIHEIGPGKLEETGVTWSCVAERRTASFTVMAFIRRNTAEWVWVFMVFE
jgi:hypothetical protein